MRLSRTLLVALITAALVGAVSASLPIPPPPDHRINDYAGVLSADDRARLEDKLRARERESSNQIVVAIFRSLQGDSLEDFSIRLAQAWRVGQKGLDNGVIFLVFVDDRKMRLEVGYGLESKLTDALSSQILRQVVAPRFREGKIADGIAAGLDAIEQVIAGTYKAAPQAQGRGRGDGAFPLILLFIVIGGILTIVVPALFSSHTRRQGWTGGSRGWGGPIIFPGGGWGGGGGGSGGGGGDFSGGGGGFGGGGASGDW